MITFSTSTEQDLLSILELQKQNLPQSLTPSQIKEEGFVTLRHSLELLRKMNTLYQHIIAKDGNQVIAYALVMDLKFENEIPDLSAMFKQLEIAKLNDTLINKNKIFIMGQICIAKAYRRQGIFRGLYKCMKKEMRANFDFVVTEIALLNTRSLNAHLAIGFTIMVEYSASGGEKWAVVALDLRT